MSPLRNRARRLRKDQTDAERGLWLRLRSRQVNGAKFRRQHPVGRYVADFCCPDRMLIVELDGGQHVARAKADRRRTAFLRERGYRVLRFWDNDVLRETEVVLQQIADAVSDPHPGPLPNRERGHRGTGSLRRGPSSRPHGVASAKRIPSPPSTSPSPPEGEKVGMRGRAGRMSG
ncbi:MAG: endonuclease domain-containing protein [Candidatus Methylomirabilis oxyfera]|nr:endonuclease domain-containing protein [Candidatus Methylomirabilis oxyfera]